VLVLLKQKLQKPKRKNPNYPKFDWKKLITSPVIGVDEVGRGCLAGRVYAAAVILKSDGGVKDYTDSKLLLPERRQILAKQIIGAHHVGIGFASVEEIDRLNILKASLLAMKRAVEQLNVSDGHIVVDGIFNIPDLLGFQQTPLIKGDLRCAPVAAASIVAKVTRDQYMAELAKEYPLYDFEIHKGYSTKIHKERIAVHGPSPEHRKTFQGVLEYLQSNPL
jgi:ribonuclease HII